MPLEATIICIDNSEYQRNGDHAPRRFDCQIDAVQAICRARLNENAENTVGMLAMGGHRPTVVSSPSREIDTMLASLYRIPIKEKSDIYGGIVNAQMALKHRGNKNQRQRVVLMIGSPMEMEERACALLGRQMKKNNVAIDIVLFADIEANLPKVHALHNAVNAAGSSRLVISASGGMSLVSAVREGLVQQEALIDDGLENDPAMLAAIERSREEM